MGYENILLKLSGASIHDNENNDHFSYKDIDAFTSKIKSLVKNGKHIAIVVGGGNVWRGKDGVNFYLNQDRADYLGMVSTIYNCEIISSMLKKKRVKNKVFSSIKVEHLTKKYDVNKVKSYFDKGYVILLAGGTGRVGCSTDTASALRASELGINSILVLKNGIDGIYDRDPNKYSDANLYSYISYDDYLDKKLEAIDLEAIEICKKENIKMVVFDANNLDNIDDVLSNKKVGTTIGG